MTDAALTPDEQARFDALYGSAPPAAAPDSPGVFTGAYKGLAGIPSGLAGAPLSAASAATGMPSIDAGYLGSLGVDPEQFKKDAQDYFSTTWQYAVHAPIEQLRQDAADYYRPDPQTTGFVGNTLFGATDVLTRVGVGNLFAPGAGLPLAAGTTAYERTQDLEGQGVDATTAQASGALTGASLLASGGLSAFGTTAVMRALTGAGLNAGFGAGTRALDSSILDAHGYTAQADQQRWSDAASVAADLIIGGAFHLLPTRGEGAPAKPAAETVDAALTAKAAQGVTDSAPGVPADPRSASAHVTALDTAQAQLVEGQPVAVDPIVRDATFAPRPEPHEPLQARTLPEVGTIIDTRLAALDELAKGVRGKDELAALGKEAGDLEDLLREQYRARDQGVMQSADTGLTPDEMAFAEQRLSDVRQQLEQHRQAIAARNDAERLRHRLANTDSDAELRAIADAIHPELRTPTQSDPVLREAMVEAGIPADQLDAPPVHPDHAPNFGLPEAPQTIPEGDAFWSAIPGRETANIAGPERDALRSSIVDQHFADVPARSRLSLRKPVAYLMGGGGGAGKGTVRDLLQANGIIPKDGAVHIDPDAIKAAIPEYRHMLDRGDSRAAAVVHEESSQLAKQVLARAIAGKHDIVLDRTLGDKAKGLAEIQALMKAGYDVRLYGVTIDPKEAVRRAVGRAAKSGRFVPLDRLLAAHKGFAEAFGTYAETVHSASLFDNGGDKGESPRLIADAERGKLTLHDEQAYNRFRGRSQINDQATTLAEITPAQADARAGDRPPEAGIHPRSHAEVDQGARGRGEQPGPGPGLEADRLSAPADALDAQASSGAGRATESARAAQPRDPSGSGTPDDGARLDPARDGDVALARKIAAEHPDLVLDDGTTAADALRAADQDVQEAQRQAEGIGAAVACFLRFGADA